MSVCQTHFALVSLFIPMSETDQKIFSSMKALSTAKGIPIAQIKIAKSLNAPGFNSNNSINWRTFEPWYLANKTDLETKANDTLEFYKKEIAKETLKKLRKQMFDRQEVIAFLSKVETKQATVFKTSIKDLISKYPHLKIELESLVQSVCATFRDEEAKWML